MNARFVLFLKSHTLRINGNGRKNIVNDCGHLPASPGLLGAEDVT